MWARRPVARMVEFVTPSNQSVRTRWLRQPDLQAGQEVCLFVAYARDSTLARHSIFHARSWADAGFQVVILVICDAFSADFHANDVGFASGLLIRENRGYDFG